MLVFIRAAYPSLMSGHATNLFRLIVVLIAVSAANVRADVRLPSIISDNMVLQRGVRVRIWGNAKPGEHVSVTAKNKSAKAVADAQGQWQGWLGPLKAGGPAGDG